jgi:hypothetical protein
MHAQPATHARTGAPARRAQGKQVRALRPTQRGDEVETLSARAKHERAQWRKSIGSTPLRTSSAQACPV